MKQTNCKFQALLPKLKFSVFSYMADMAGMMSASQKNTLADSHG
jgi:hypothetical protein